MQSVKKAAKEDPTCEPVTVQGLTGLFTPFSYHITLQRNHIDLDKHEFI